MHLTINIHDVILGKKEPSLNYKNAILRISLTYNLPAKIELEIYWKLQTLHTGLLSDSYDNRNPWVPDDTINFLYIKKVKKRIDRVEAGLSWKFDAFNTKLDKTRKWVLSLSKLSLKSNKTHITWLAMRKHPYLNEICPRNVKWPIFCTCSPFNHRHVWLPVKFYKIC